MKPSSWVKALLTCGALAVCGVVLAHGQVSTPDTGGSLAALTAEVRLLRVAVEKSTETQAQMQALGVYLSAQQSRLVQTAARVDLLRKDLDTAVQQSRMTADQITNFDRGLATADPADRIHLEQAQVQLKQSLARATAQEAQIRSRESEASQALQVEEARWSDLIARLEQAIKR